MLLFTFSGTTVLLGMATLCLLIVVGIFLTRRQLRNAREEAADLFSLSPAIHRVALCAAIFTAFLAINWTQFREMPVYASGPIVLDEIIEVIPRTIDPPKRDPPPPPPPLAIEPVVDEAPPIDLTERAVSLDDFVAMPPPPSLQTPKSVPPPPPLPPPAPPEDAAPVLFAERMPVFGEACQKLTGEERKVCSDRELLTFVQQNVSYPPIARENGIQGVVVVRFVVERDGTVSSIESIRELGGGCTAAATRAVDEINRAGKKFSPGIQGGRTVRVAFNLPVKFKLTD
ncbi:protein TonB [Lewinella aquimaris]|uniref:Protein TonB n=1 Tax=Neolewinella aquimaris TaxID=1835722 RepID=A0A840E2K5_9BACT|nr:energy transducer TonB [Neolewinella aquimaris]MBB4079330.1 protein TonB [Neolewinella aquimaris]